MRREIILDLANAMEAGSPVLGFNAKSYCCNRRLVDPSRVDHSGGDHDWVGDLCAWAAHLYDSSRKRRHVPLDPPLVLELFNQTSGLEHLAKILDIEEFQASLLSAPDGVAWTRITLAEQVDVLRHFAETEKIVWAFSGGEESEDV
jgi:hypothetical protein